MMWRAADYQLTVNHQSMHFCSKRLIIFFNKRLKNTFAQGVEDFKREPNNFWGSSSQFLRKEVTVFEEETVISPVDNLPGVWNDPHSVAADDNVDDVDVDPRQRHLPLSQSAL